MRGAAVKRADRNDRRLERIDLAADDLLQVDDELGGDQNRIDRLMRRRTVAAAPMNRDFDRIAGRVERALVNADEPDAMLRREM